jgi:predicted MFS family arabinose efflux permease
MLSMVGAARDPDRAFGLYYATIYLGASALVVLGAWVVAQYQVAGGYMLLALLLTCIYPIARRVPVTEGSPRRAKHDTSAPTPLVGAVMSLLGYFLFCAGLGGTWAFIERIGHHGGLAAATIGWALAIGPYGSVAGALTAAAVRTRFGRFAPTLVSVGLAVVSTMLLSFATTGAFFAAGVLMFSFAWSLFLACLGGVLAAQDPGGRVIAMSITSQTLGMAVGPAAAGFLVASFGYNAVGLLSVGCYCAGFLLLLPVLAELQERQFESAPYRPTSHTRPLADQ